MSVLDRPRTDSPAAPRRSPLVASLVAVIALAALVVVAGGGYLWGHHSSSSAASPSAVDVGFARDMSTHHRQAVTMAEAEQNQGSDAQAKLFAFDINSAQSVQMGEMQGWLDSWGKGTDNPRPMAWMGAHMAHMVGPNGLMPGMATPAQMTTLRSATGTKADVLFLQLMIRHHQGGVHMAEAAAKGASEPYVRALAQKMVDLQQAEIVQMEQTLRKLGGTPLSPPAE